MLAKVYYEGLQKYVKVPETDGKFVFFDFIQANRIHIFFVKSQPRVPETPYCAKMALTLSNAMMARMSLKGKCGKLPFAKSRLCLIICDAVISAFQVTQTKVLDTMTKYLKYAPERMGGGGRKKSLTSTLPATPLPE